MIAPSCLMGSAGTGGATLTALGRKEFVLK
jgi:hypothetical protein